MDIGTPEDLDRKRPTWWPCESSLLSSAAERIGSFTYFDGDGYVSVTAPGQRSGVAGSSSGCISFGFGLALSPPVGRRVGAGFGTGCGALDLSWWTVMSITFRLGGH
jgi:hypothetical protein